MIRCTLLLFCVSLPTILLAQSQPERQPIFARKLNVTPDSGMDSSEFIPSVTPDGLTMIYVSTDIPGGLGGEEMWMATRSHTDEPFGPVIGVPQINSASEDTAGSFSADGLTFYFGSDRAESGDWDIYSATRPSLDASFGAGQLLGGSVNTEGRIENAARVSADGLTMVYQVRGIDEQNADIWIATRDSLEGDFSNAHKLEIAGPDAEDWWPNLSADGLTLFLSDQPNEPVRPGGEGREDIWVATRESVDEPFAAPQNPDELWPGTQINSHARTGYPFVSQDWPALGSKLYFIEASGGSGPDIFQMTWMVPESGDINLDGWQDVADLDLMCRSIWREDSDVNPNLDLNADGTLTLADMDLLRADLQVLPGDANFDGKVNFDDLVTLTERFGRRSAVTTWSRADFNCDGVSEFLDFLLLSENFGRSYDEAVSVPEPHGWLCVVFSVAVFLRHRWTDTRATQ